MLDAPALASRLAQQPPWRLALPTGAPRDPLITERRRPSPGAKLELHQPTVERMREAYAKRGMELNDARLRMATLPAPAEVLFSEGTW